MATPTITIELNAVWRGGRWEVIDAHGKCIAVIGPRLLSIARKQHPTPGAWLDDPWRKATRRMIGQLLKSRRDGDLGTWGRKFQSIAQSGRRRQFGKQKRGKKRKAAVGWDERIRALCASMKQRGKRAGVDEWTKWSENVVRNIRHRQAIREAHGQEGA